MKTENNVHIYPDATTLSEAATRLIIGIINEAISQQGRCTIALSGGHTPQGVYATLATQPYCDEIDWHKTFFFWGDERCVPPNDPMNNAYLAKKIFLNQIPVPDGNIFPIDCSISPNITATHYEESIRDFFGEWHPRFDLILLGLGENGHTASLFPGNEQVLDDMQLVVDVYVPEQEMHRVTMTPYLINNATHIMFLVTGIEKAAILKQTLSGPQRHEDIPAQAIQPRNGTLYWLVDKAAASLILKHTVYED